MLSQVAEERLDRAEREVQKKIWESALRPLRDSMARSEPTRPGDAEAAPIDAQNVYHLLQSISHRLDRLERRIDGQEAAARSDAGRRAKRLRTAAALAALATFMVGAFAAWRLIPAGARPDPFLVPERHGSALPGRGF